MNGYSCRTVEKELNFLIRFALLLINNFKGLSTKAYMYIQNPYENNNQITRIEVKCIHI